MKSTEQREKVRKASTEGIAIQGQQGVRLLPEQLISEAFILSDLFDLGELAALELLLAGTHTAHTYVVLLNCTLLILNHCSEIAMQQCDLYVYF